MIIFTVYIVKNIEKRVVGGMGGRFMIDTLGAWVVGL